jgi:hypothetical protein
LHLDQPKVPPVSGAGTAIAVFVSAWLALVFVFAARGAFYSAPGTPPLGLLFGLVAPLGLFLGGYWTSRAFREFVLSVDLRVIVAIQAWRWAGFGFLSLYTYKVLPGIFALTAGIGDMAIGVTAPFVLAALLRNSDFATGRRFITWNLSGILDLAVAASIGAVIPIFAPSLFGSVTTAPMSRLPLLLVPTFLVPIFLILHLTALFQARRPNS